VLEDLMGDQSLQKFRGEYEKLHKALQKTHDSEKRLMQKCRELNAEIVANSAKVSTALKLSQDDQATINNLKKVGITPCDAMLARVLAMALCLFVSVSVCLSQVGVLLKWLDGSSWFLEWRLLSTNYLINQTYMSIHLSP